MDDLNNIEELEDKLGKEQEFLEQTIKAIEHYEQNKLAGPHVQHIIDLLHKSYNASKALIAELKAKAITNKLTEKYGKPYMEK